MVSMLNDKYRVPTRMQKQKIKSNSCNLKPIKCIECYLLEMAMGTEIIDDLNVREMRDDNLHKKKKRGKNLQRQVLCWIRNKQWFFLKSMWAKVVRKATTRIWGGWEEKHYNDDNKSLNDCYIVRGGHIGALTFVGDSKTQKKYIK